MGLLKVYRGSLSERIPECVKATGAYRDCSLPLCPQEFEKLSDFFKTHYRLELMEKDLCVKGWNWGTVKFGGESWVD